MIIIHDVEQGTEEWLKLREKLYTGQNAEKVLKYSQHVKVVDGVVSRYAINEITGFTGNFYTERGHELEKEALELYGRITGHVVSTVGFVTNTDFPGCGVSPDGHDDEIEYLLECKAFKKDLHLAMLKGDIPLKVLSQIHFGITVWERKGGKLLAYNPDLAKEGRPDLALGIIDIPRNEKICNNFRRVLAV